MQEFIGSARTKIRIYVLNFIQMLIIYAKLLVNAKENAFLTMQSNLNFSVSPITMKINAGFLVNSTCTEQKSMDAVNNDNLFYKMLYLLS